jgi:hypothetical protein
MHLRRVGHHGTWNDSVRSLKDFDEAVAAREARGVPSSAPWGIDPSQQLEF